MFQRQDQWPGTGSGGAAMAVAGASAAAGVGALRAPGSQAVPFGAALAPRFVRPELGWRERLETSDWVPDLGVDIGSATWWRGLALLGLLCGSALATWPGMQPLSIAAPTMDAADYDEARAQIITPIAYGSDSGRRMAATDAVTALASAPERPQIEMTATFGQGDSFARLLERSGLGGAEAGRVAAMVADTVPLSDIAAGTRVDLVLGRRSADDGLRPLDALAMRARFDLRVEIDRVDGRLVLRRVPIGVDATPLRIRGEVGSSGLYRSARAAGASPQSIQSYLRVLAGQMEVSDVAAGDEFDIIVDHRRAETGEAESGKLLYAGLLRDGKPRVQVIEWTTGGRSQWFEARGVGQQRTGFVQPTAGRMSSGYGMRVHPILRFKRMHSGIDFAPGYGAPIHAVTDGTVLMAGRNGGYGNFVKLSHGGGLASGYAHMSRMAVAPGQHVRRGQVIGYVGSTGLSTGPHLHYELYRNGAPINPLSVQFTTRSLLEGAELSAFRAKLRRLTDVAPGAALQGKVRTFDAPRAAGLSRIAGTPVVGKPSSSPGANGETTKTGV